MPMNNINKIATAPSATAVHQDCGRTITIVAKPIIMQTIAIHPDAPKPRRT